MKDNINIRKMEMKDICQVLFIEKMSFATPWARESFERELRENKLAKYIVAEIDKKVVGYGGVWLILDEGHITNIAVHNEYRGFGIGHSLVDGLINVCDELNIERMTLEVRISNIFARNLYKNHGFVDIGIRPGYYADNKEDAVIMWKEL
ncbi:ribosomal protein S18-alanine N-acetyltransferase [Anaeromonas gelatinilytica]|uniref:ribosomal protein S18-alanine N-acetyltransferase n=1 Tax=Anaeromonas gelatinilytica TaxID=2683194 RepID=UPI00207864DE|nr:ribosomal protein S18-alanine N-acetyltransferase [Anaeromonas gelatinilytica]